MVLLDEVRTFTAVIPPKISSLSTTPIPAGGPIPPPTPPLASSHDDIDDSESSDGSDEEIVFQRGRRRPITSTDIDGLTTPQYRHGRSSRVLRRVRANIHEASPSGSGSVSPPTGQPGASAPPTPPKDAAPSGLHHPKSLKRSPKSAYFADGTEIPGLNEHLGREEQNLLDLNEFVWKDEVDNNFAPYITPPITGGFLEPKEVEEEQVSVGELEGSLEENIEIHEALYAEFAMAHEIGIALGSPPAVERRLEFALDPEHESLGDDKSVNSDNSVKSIKSEKSEGIAESHQSEPSLESESESESEYESEPEHSIPGAFKDEDEVLAEINGLKKKGKGKSKSRGKDKAKAEEAAVTHGETDSKENTKEEEDESENEAGRYPLLEATVAKARINGAGGRKVTPWPTPRMVSYRSSLENVEGETPDSPGSVGEPAEEMAEKATSAEAAEIENADTDENDYTDEEDEEVFYDAEEGGLASPPMSPASRSYFHSRHAGLDNLPRSPRSPKSPKSPQENKLDLVLVQSASEASASGSNPSSPNSPEHPGTPKKIPLPIPGPPAFNLIPATPLPAPSPGAELKNPLGNPPPSLLHRKPTGQVQTLKSSQDPTSPTKPSIPVPKHSTSFPMSGTRKTARRPSISSQPKSMRESKLHPWWRPRHDDPNDAEGTGLSRTISAPHTSAYAQELHRTESATSIGKKRVTKPIKGTKFQIEFIGVGTIKAKGGVLKEKLNTGSGAMKRKFSLKKRPTNF